MSITGRKGQNSSRTCRIIYHEHHIPREKSYSKVVLLTFSVSMNISTRTFQLCNKNMQPYWYLWTGTRVTWKIIQQFKIIAQPSDSVAKNFNLNLCTGWFTCISHCGFLEGVFKCTSENNSCSATKQESISTRSKLESSLLIWGVEIWGHTEMLDGRCSLTFLLHSRYMLPGTEIASLITLVCPGFKQMHTQVKYNPVSQHIHHL